MPERFACSDSLLWVVDQHLHDQVHALIRHMRNQMPDPCTSLGWKVELDMGILVPFEPLEHVLLRGTQNIVDLVDLVELVLSREQWEERQDLEPHAARAPEVHLVGVVPVREQALGRAVPAGELLPARLVRSKQLFIRFERIGKVVDSFSVGSDCTRHMSTLRM